MQSKWSEMRKLALGALKINPKYQRNLDMKWVAHIVENFDEDLVGVPQVSYNGRQFFVFDGQHTVKALEIVMHDHNYPVVCKVYHGLTSEEEAKLFHKFNTSRKGMSTLSIIKARAAYGDEETRSFLQCTKDAGFIIDPSKPRHCRCSIRAIKKANACFLSLGSENYRWMLSMLKRTWNGEPWSVSHNILSGMELLIRTFWKELGQNSFAKRMSFFSDDDIDREAAQYYSLSLPYRYAWAIGTLYNKKGNGLDLSRLNFVKQD